MISRTNAWDISDATAHLRELVERARTEGPQAITVDGEEVAVVRAAEPSDSETSEQIGEASRSERSLVEFFMASPYPEIDLLPDRDYGTLRDLDL